MPPHAQSMRRSVGVTPSLLAGGLIIAVGAPLVYPDDEFTYNSIGALSVLVSLACAAAMTVQPPHVRVFSTVGLIATSVAIGVVAVVMYSDWGYYPEKYNPWLFVCVVTAGIGGGFGLAARETPWLRRMLVAAAGGFAGVIAALIGAYVGGLAGLDFCWGDC